MKREGPHRFMDRYAVLFGQYRLRLTLSVVALTVLCLFGTSRVTFDNDADRLFRSDKFTPEPSDQEIARLGRAVLIVVDGENLMAREGVEAIRRMGLAASNIKGVEAVYSMVRGHADINGSKR